MAKDYQVIILGTTCFARYIATKAGLKPTKVEGELSMPFDLAVHFPKSIPDIISSNFKNYLKDIRKNEEGIFEFYYKRTILSKPKKIAWLNHDNDLNGDKNKLIERYQRRIKNFQEAIKKDIPTIFVQSCDFGYEPNKLIKVLKKKRGQKPYSVIFIDIGNNLNITPQKNIYTVKVEYPFKDYIWYSEEHRNTLEGQAFENNIVEDLKEIFNELNIK